MKYPTSPVEPVNPPAPYLGGKRFLASTIIARIGEVDHGLYAEPFVGMGGVFFRRDRRPDAEVINDRNGDVVNLFRILQRHYAAFMDHLKFQLTSRREFERLSRTDPATLTDLERAARFLYLQRTALWRQGSRPELWGIAGASRPFRHRPNWAHPRRNLRAPDAGHYRKSRLVGHDRPIRPT